MPRQYRPVGEPWRTEQSRALLKAQLIANGGAICAICGDVVTPDQPWDAHHPYGPADPRCVVAHRHCNRGFERRGIPSPRSAHFFR